MTSKNKGIALAGVTMLISGFSIFINKFAVGAVNPPLVFTGVKNAIVGILIIAILVGLKKLPLVKKLKRNELVKLSLIGIIGGALPFYLFFTALAMIPAVNAALIHKSLIFWVALLAIPFLKERLSLIQVGAIGLLFSSNLVVGGFKGFEFALGELMVLGATMLWAIENVIAKKTLSTVDPDIVTAARMGIGSIVMLVVAQVRYPGAVMGIFSMTALQWIWMVVTALALAGYVMSWYRALKFAPATLVATILVGSTIITNVLSAIFITHNWTMQMGVQAAMIVAGLTIFIAAAKKVDLHPIAKEN